MNVFIVEDSPIMLKDLHSMLSGIPDITIVGHAVDESGAIERINALRPDVVTLDIRLETGSGIDVLKNIKKHHGGIKILVLTNCINKIYAEYCMYIGADHFFDKSLQLLQFREVLREWAYTSSARNQAGKSRLIHQNRLTMENICSTPSNDGEGKNLSNKIIQNDSATKNWEKDIEAFSSIKVNKGITVERTANAPNIFLPADLTN